MTRLAALVVVVAACRVPIDGGNGDDVNGTVDAAPGPVSQSCQDATSHSDLAWIQKNVFDASCNFGGCHEAPASNAGHLVLEDGQAHANLVGQAAQTEPGWMRVTAGTADTSYLLAAIGQMPGPMPTGGLMPLASPELCAEKREALQRWIEAGAQP
jgi:hypothetical protein